MEIFTVVPIFTALIQGLKMAFLPSKYALLVALVLGVAFSFWSVGVNPDAAIFGLVLGLSSCGLYDAAKPVVSEVKTRLR